MTHDKQDNKALILVVDDVTANIQILGNILHSDEYQVIPATSGQQALKLAKKRHPDIVLLDIMMPEMDGFEVCAALKEDDETSHIPVIFLTAKSEMEDVVKGLDLGACDYITKLFNSKELRARVRTHLELKFHKDCLLNSNNEQQKLLHMLCHDLANPVGAILSTVETLDGEPMGDSLAEEVELISAAAKNASDVIELVREMRLLEKKEPKVGKVHLRKAVEESYSLLAQKFRSKEVALRLDIDPDILVKAEKRSLVNSVLSNLLSNALKFSFHGGEIVVSCEVLDEHVLFRVKDNGVGIPQELLNIIFDETQFTSRRGTEGEKGTGFGMPLVRKYINAYGARIDIKSTPRLSAEDHPGGAEVEIAFKKVD